MPETPPIPATLLEDPRAGCAALLASGDDALIASLAEGCGVSDRGLISCGPTLAALPVAHRAWVALSLMRHLGRLDGLQKLIVRGFDALTDLSRLSGLERLEQVDLNGLPITDLDFVTVLPGLKTIEIDGCRRLTSLSALSALPALESLVVTECDLLVDFSALRGLSSLRCLRLYDYASASGLETVFTLSELAELELGLEGSHSLAAVNQMLGLEALNISTEAPIPLLRLPRLRELQLSGQGVISLEPLRALPALSSLRLDSCDNLNSLADLEALTSLQAFTLEESDGVADIRALGRLEHLTEVSLLWHIRLPSRSRS